MGGFQSVAQPITIVGCGPGSSEYLTQAAVRAVGEALYLIGSKRLLALFPETEAERVDVGASVERALAAIEERRAYGGIAVLVSGDPGICSMAKPVIEKFGAEHCRVIPGVSSVQLAFARIGEDWYGAKFISAHDADPALDKETLKGESKIAVLAGRDAAIEWSAELADTLGDGWRSIVCEDLALENEKITDLSAAELKGYKASTMTVVLFIKKESK
ncbi:MAG: precorrin-6y C5,15-methyltransferase (decarboxylating) subunit CbiE [Nitrospinae bacterium]|nr:precorrin-6y C5,15-methyltransferase (decarboxylating) subunit CbiE [Nitrospinota bacterium]